jgi:hypothetical protein
MNRTALKFLKSLRDAPPEGIPWSALPISCTNLLSRLQTCGAVQIVPGVQGKRLRVANADAFAKIVRTATPQGLESLDSLLLSRADAVDQIGDAKAIRAGNVQGIFIRSIKPNIFIRRAGSSEAVDVTAMTRIAGGAALMLRDGMEWSFAGTIATIENEEAFWSHELILPHIDLAVYVRGKMSNRLLRWLASAPMASCEITHWGDYDPIGVAEFLRLRRACPGRVTLHVPDDLEKLIARYGKKLLVRADKQVRVLCVLRGMEDDAIVKRFVQVFDELGKGVEQELLLKLAKALA